MNHFFFFFFKPRGWHAAKGRGLDSNIKLLWRRNISASLLATPQPASAQLAEVIGLMKALQQREGLRVNLYADSTYAHGAVHVDGPQWAGRSFLTTASTPVKHREQLEELIKPVLQWTNDGCHSHIFTGTDREWHQEHARGSWNLRKTSGSRKEPLKRRDSGDLMMEESSLLWNCASCSWSKLMGQRMTAKRPRWKT